MPLFLIPIISWFSTSIVTLVTYFLTKKGLLFTVMIAIIALVGSAITLFIEEMDTIFASIIPPSASFAVAFVPDNMAVCLGAIVSAHIACTTFKLAIKLISWKTRVMTS